MVAEYFYKTGVTHSIASLSPPAITANFPVFAPISPPETGASME